MMSCCRHAVMMSWSSKMNMVHTTRHINTRHTTQHKDRLLHMTSLWWCHDIIMPMGHDWRRVESYTHHPSPITHHPSPITHHPSPITHSSKGFDTCQKGFQKSDSEWRIIQAATHRHKVCSSRTIYNKLDVSRIHRACSNADRGAEI